MNFHAHYAGIGEPVETCLVGSGSFGRSYLAQSRRTRLVNARIAVDVTAEAAGKAFAAAGFGPADIALCETAAEAKVAWNAGRCVAAASLDIVMELPFALLVEATGSPEAATRRAPSCHRPRSGRDCRSRNREAECLCGAARPWRLA